MKPELLSPAGDMERLVAALNYGADAVYLGGTSFGMRSAPMNFDFAELKKAVEEAHRRGVKVYFTLNILPYSSEMELLPSFIQQAAAVGADAFIVADLGVLSFVKKYAPDTDIHISTQTGIVNYEAANMMHDMGAKRVVLARELSLDDIAAIRAKTPSDLEIECFVHGAMCVAFSGRCMLSNYLVGRNANKGDCSQPCRWKYHLMEETRPGEYFPIGEDDSGTYIMNSMDMSMIEHIPELLKAGIYSFKIEGRAKSAYYTAVITNAYRNAIDELMKNPSDYKTPQWIADEVRKVSYREYCTGFYFGHPKDDANISYKGGYIREWEVMGVVEDYSEGILTVSQRNRFFRGDTLEIIEPKGKPFKIKIESMLNENGEEIDSAPHPMMKVRIRCARPVKAGAYLRKKLESAQRGIV